MDTLNRYRKTIAAVVTGLIGWTIAYQVVDEQWVALATVLATALGVFIIPNAPAPEQPAE